MRYILPTIQSLQTTLHRVPRELLALLVCIAPAFAVWVVLTLFLRVNIFNFVPNTLSDQVGNWHYVYTFSHVGFNGGYYAPHELTAPSPTVRFDVIGPTFPILYGTIAHFTGWYPYSGILFNMVAVGLALAAFIYLAGLNHEQILLTGIFILSYWTILIFIPTVMQESINHTFAILLAGLFYILITQASASPLHIKIITGIMLLVAALLRSSWTILFFPYWLMILPNRRFIVRLIGATVLSVVITIAVIQILQYTSPPSNNSVLTAAASFRQSIADGLNNVFVAIRENFKTLGDTLSATPTFPLQLAHHIGFIIISLCMIVLIFRRTRNDNSTALREALFQLYNLSIIIIAGLVLYLAGGFPRVFAVHLLLSLMIAIAFKRFRLVLVVALTNFVLVGAVGYDLATYRNGNFRSDPAERAALQAEVNNYIVYHPAADPWCNTILVPVSLYDGRVTLIPPGIGVSYFWNIEEMNFPLKSRYVLLTPETYSPIQAETNLQLLAHLSVGDIYLNLDSPCDSPT